MKKIHILLQSVKISGNIHKDVSTLYWSRWY